MRLPITSALLVSLFVPGLAWAQDPPEKKKKKPTKAEAKEKKKLIARVERPDELKRIRASLKRIQATRFRLTGKKVSIQGQPRPPARLVSPILSKRRKVLGLTLKDAIGQALENNPDYLVALLDAKAARENVPQARAIFDPTLSFSGTWVDSRSPLFSTIVNPFTGAPAGLSVGTGESLALSTTVSQLLPTGTVLALTWDDGRSYTKLQTSSLNPSYAPSLSFTVTQPLLKGFGIDVNLAALRNARNDSLASDATLAEIYLDAVLAIEQSYWGLIQTEENLRSQERSLSSSLQFLADQRKREQAGAGTKLEVTIAKAGVATRREAVIAAENGLEESRDQIIRLCRPSSEADKWNLLVVPLELPLVVKEPDLDVAQAIQTALKRRPDYYRAMLTLENARRNLKTAKNNALPSLNLVGTWRQEGLGGQHHSAWSTVGSGRFYTWSVGVRVDLPLFLRSERAQVRQANLLLERAKVSLRATEANVVLEVRSAIRAIRTSKARIEASRASRILAEERLAATREMLKAGTAVPRDVLEDLANLSLAENREVSSFVTYRLAISALKKAQGTLLDTWLEKLPPRVRRALDRRPFR